MRRIAWAELKLMQADPVRDEQGPRLYLSAIYKDTDLYINANRLFFERLHGVKEIKIIGWSAGEVDIPYLLKIKNSVNKDAQWTVYCYDRDAYNSLQKALSECEILNNFAVDFQESSAFWDMSESVG